MKDFLREQFQIEVSKISQLGGLDNANYLIETAEGKFVLKVYPYSPQTASLIASECEVLEYLIAGGVTHIQSPVPLNGELTPVVEKDGQRIICRLLTFLEGQFLLEVPQTEELYASLGHALANMDLLLRDFHQPTYEARRLEWDILHLGMNRPLIDYIQEPTDRTLVEYFFQQFDEQVLPKRDVLRMSIIYNDANEWNLLARGGEISGIIDFGDMAYTLLVNEVAIAITYACYSQEDPLRWAHAILGAYHAVLPLQEEELEVLYYLIATRLCISICHAAYARREDSDNDYAFVSEKYAWQMLRKWIKINPIAAENHFREAIGLPKKQAPRLEDLLAKRQRLLSPVLSVSYRKPIYMERAALQYMYDAEGHTFLDAYNNIPVVGHCHPRVVEAGQRQMAKLNTNTRYIYDVLNNYAERLLDKFPESLNRVFFVNSGSAATDLALRMSRAHTGRRGVMVMEHGYHGNTLAAVDVSHYKFNHPKGTGTPEKVLVAPLADTYRGPYDGLAAGRRYAEESIEMIRQSTMPLGAFISETILGCAGQVPLADGYLQHLYPAIRQQGGVCIADEVQTGFGRMGNYFWSFEAHGVVPDIVVLGKPMANGHPMGAVVCTEEVAASFENGPEFFSSFGGNPVSCAIGLAVLDVIDQEGLQVQAQEVGSRYKSLFLELQKHHPCIGDVRGEGLFLGADIVKEGTKTPYPQLAAYIKNGLRERHILISTDGPKDNVLKTKPPLCFTEDNARQTVEAIEQVLAEYRDSGS